MGKVERKIRNNMRPFERFLNQSEFEEMIKLLVEEQKIT